MDVRIRPSKLAGRIAAPPSKSEMHRALIAAALCGGQTRIRPAVLSEDTGATARCLEALGAEIKKEEGALVVRPIAKPLSAELDCGESGTTARLLLPVAAALGAKAEFTGRGRLPERPMSGLVACLNAHGAAIEGSALPLRIGGALSGGEFHIDGSLSSQFVSGLLFALPLVEGGGVIAVEGALASAPYVEMTLDLLEKFGVSVVRQGRRFAVAGGKYRSPGELVVGGDWSAAAFFFAANALGARIEIGGLRDNTRQGDAAAKRLFFNIPSEVDMSDIPDLAPALAVAAAFGGGVAMTGAARLRAKESDRIASTVDMINSLGGRAEALGDGLVVHPKRPTGGRVDGRGDHRIVMAAAIAGAFCENGALIGGAQAVAKSYGGFFEDFKRCGGKIDVL